MDEPGSARPDAVEAWAVGAQARVDGLKAEMRMGGGKRHLRARAYALRDEFDARMRALDEIAE